MFQFLGHAIRAVRPHLGQAALAAHQGAPQPHVQGDRQSIWVGTSEVARVQWTKLSSDPPTISFSPEACRTVGIEPAAVRDTFRANLSAAERGDSRVSA